MRIILKNYNKKEVEKQMENKLKENWKAVSDLKLVNEGGYLARPVWVVVMEKEDWNKNDTDKRKQFFRHY